jgi:hypothetical protein
MPKFQGIVLPTTADVRADLTGVLNQAKKWGTFSDQEEDTIDVRLQVHDNGDWYLHAGDSSFDTDHRGYWGSSSISVGETQTTLQQIASQLLNEVKDSIAQSR